MNKKSNHKYIFIVGGVISSVGKGVTSASLGTILQSRGYKVANVKCDMYVNLDAGTIRPTEHGEVFVGDDGIEADQDLGNYERFTNQIISRINYITTGQIYWEVIKRERSLEYHGEDVEVVPDVPNEIIRRIELAHKTRDADITIVEIGGTVGEYQVLLFLEAARMMKLRNPDDVAFIRVSSLPIPPRVGEMKTKPTQYAIRTLNSAGIQADVLIARASTTLDERCKTLLAANCNMQPGSIISAPDLNSIYDIPVNYEEQGVGDLIVKRLGLQKKKNSAGLTEWKKFVKLTDNAKGVVNIAVIGKYFNVGRKFMLSDSYISVIESLKFATAHAGKNPKFTWLDSEVYEKHPEKLTELSAFDGIVVPGGFGKRGVEGLILAIQYARENKIPYFGLCYGMQLAIIEYARNVLRIKDAMTTEIDPKTKSPVVDLMPEQLKNLQKENFGGSMRLGSYVCDLKAGTIASEAYAKQSTKGNGRWQYSVKNIKGKKIETIKERHRHRYEVNPNYVIELEKGGIVFSGTSEKGLLMEIMELPKNLHPFFLATQFHPEFTSSPLESHPLFQRFVNTAMKRQNASRNAK